MIKAIETVYKGYRFRSRLEARWAVFFDTLTIKWEYEKEGYDIDGKLYLPDFFLPDADLFIEVKGEMPSRDKLKLYSEFSHESSKDIWIAIGEPVEARLMGFDSSIAGWNQIGSGHLAWCILLRHHPAENVLFKNVNEVLELTEQGQWLANQCLSAAIVARQARFEYGETPIIR